MKEDIPHVKSTAELMLGDTNHNLLLTIISNIVRLITQSDQF